MGEADLERRIVALEQRVTYLLRLVRKLLARLARAEQLISNVPAS